MEEDEAEAVVFAARGLVMLREIVVGAGNGVEELDIELTIGVDVELRTESAWL